MNKTRGKKVAGDICQKLGVAISDLERVFVRETAKLCWSNNPIQTEVAQEQLPKEQSLALPTCHT